VKIRQSSALWFEMAHVVKKNSTDHSLTRREIYREIKINRQINDEVFQFTPPPGAKFVEREDLISFRAVISDRIKRWL
jgi:hypothetical protein